MGHPISSSIRLSSVSVEELTQPRNFSHLISWSMDSSVVYVEGVTKNFSHRTNWSLHLSYVAVESPSNNFSHPTSWSMDVSSCVADAPAKSLIHLMRWSLHLSTVVAEELRYQRCLPSNKNECDCAFLSSCSAA